jgi:SNF2 family DNA or RNA helicase
MAADRDHGDAVRAELDRFRELAESIQIGRKLHAVKEILDKYPGKFLIFTEYRATMEVIVRTLSEWGESAVAFHGGLSIHEKEEAVALFRGTPSGSEAAAKPKRRRKTREAIETTPTTPPPSANIRVMVSTESGAEGRNLQFCHQLINYDLPWNPMRVEQRIGRLHRLGQQHEVVIFNLSCNETIEAHVIDLLARKIRMFELVIGELDLILGSVEGDRSFEDLLREAWSAATSEGDLIERLNQLGEVLVHARRSYDQVQQNNRALDLALDGESE